MKPISACSAALPLTEFIQAEKVPTEDLHAEMQGEVVLPGEDAYSSTRQKFTLELVEGR